jgi:hypothetical protein
MSPEVDAYIAALPPMRRHRVAAARAMIHAAFDDVDESTQWKMPVFRRGGAYVGVASQKSYVSVYLGCSEAARRLIAADPRLKGGKACVNITDTTPWPDAALRAAIVEVLAG